MKIVGVYQIRNIVNNKVYVGSSNNIHKRWKCHVYYLRKGIHENSKLQNAWNKYSEANFIFEFLDTGICEDLLIEKEQYYLDIIKPHIVGYNINSIAGKPLICSGRRFSLMHSKKVAQYTLDGRLVKIFESAKVACKDFTGLPAISRAAKGGISTAAGFQWRYFKDKPLKIIEKCIEPDIRRGIGHRKRVAQYTLDGKLIEVFESILSASRETGVHFTSISGIVRGRFNTAGGFKWRFVNE